MNTDQISTRDGEGFRDDLRSIRAGFLGAAQLHQLTSLNAASSLNSVAQTIVITFAAIGAALAWPYVWVLLPAMFIVATQQHAMFVLAHEAAHYRLFPHRRINGDQAFFGLVADLADL